MKEEEYESFDDYLESERKQRVHFIGFRWMDL